MFFGWTTDCHWKLDLENAGKLLGTNAMPAVLHIFQKLQGSYSSYATAEEVGIRDAKMQRRSSQMGHKRNPVLPKHD